MLEATNHLDFKLTGSTYATTNDVEITGSFTTVPDPDEFETYPVEPEFLNGLYVATGMSMVTDPGYTKKLSKYFNKGDRIKVKSADAELITTITTLSTADTCVLLDNWPGNTGTIASVFRAKPYIELNQINSHNSQDSYSEIGPQRFSVDASGFVSASGNITTLQTGSFARLESSTGSVLHMGNIETPHLDAPGAIMGMTCIDSNVDCSPADNFYDILTTSYVTIGTSPDMTLDSGKTHRARCTFTAPTTEMVMIRFQVYHNAESTQKKLYFRLQDTSGISLGDKYAREVDGGNILATAIDGVVHMDWIVPINDFDTSGTHKPGDEITFDIAARTSGTSKSLLWGGDGDEAFPPLLVTVLAAPKASKISDGS